MQRGMFRFAHATVSSGAGGRAYPGGWAPALALSLLLAGCASTGMPAPSPIKTGDGYPLPSGADSAIPTIDIDSVIGTIDPDTGEQPMVKLTVMSPPVALQKIGPMPSWSCDKSGSLRRARITVTYPRTLRPGADVYIYAAIAPLDDAVESPTDYTKAELMRPDKDKASENYYSSEGYVTVADELRAKPDEPAFDQAGLGEKSINYSATTPSGVLWTTKVDPSAAGQSSLSFEFHDHSYDAACQDKDIIADSSLNILPITVIGPTPYERFWGWLAQGFNWLIALIGTLIITALTTWVGLWVNRRFGQGRRGLS